jgi:hypothetical protein
MSPVAALLLGMASLVASAYSASEQEPLAVDVSTVRFMSSGGDIVRSTRTTLGPIGETITLVTSPATACSGAATTSAVRWQLAITLVGDTPEGTHLRVIWRRGEGDQPNWSAVGRDVAVTMQPGSPVLLDDTHLPGEETCGSLGLGVRLSVPQRGPIQLFECEATVSGGGAGNRVLPLRQVIRLRSGKEAEALFDSDGADWSPGLASLIVTVTIRSVSPEAIHARVTILRRPIARVESFVEASTTYNVDLRLGEEHLFRVPQDPDAETPISVSVKILPSRSLSGARVGRP